MSSNEKLYLVLYTSVMPVYVDARSKKEAIERGHIKYNLQPEKYASQAVLSVKVKRIRKKEGGEGSNGTQKNNGGGILLS